MAVKCPKCHFENPDTQSFCGDCGTQLGTPKDIPVHTKTLETPLPQFAPGTSLANRYRIIRELGKGGMGEVYLAEDTNLKRQVAIKVLPKPFALDKERLARFEREARLLASLNHPNIATIHGLEKSDGQRFLVMELVEGDTLAERIKKGPLPVEEALEVSKQIAEGLESAHEKGIIHRDLKPSNVKVTPEGKVKILDFGLAKAFLDQPGVSEPSKSPVITDEMTRPGVILGTAAYMSPEQAKGEQVDTRTDIWAFGVVLYEMLTGSRLFAKENLSETLALVLERQPTWEELPSNVPDVVRRLLERCLRKESNKRLQAIGDARIEIEDALGEPPASLASASRVRVARPLPWRRTVPWSVAAGIAVLAALAASFIVWSLVGPDRPTGRPVTRTLVDLAPATQLELVGRPFAISQDGSLLVYTGRSEGGSQLYLREMDRFRGTPIPGTQGGHSPFFSPDGRSVGFFTLVGKLKKVSLDGRVPITICDAPSESYGASWGPDDKIIFAPGAADLMRVSAGGGIPEVVATPDREQGERAYYWPEILPGGDAVLLTIWKSGGIDDARITVLSLKTAEQKVLLDAATGARYSPTGHLVYATSSALLAVPFDPDELALGGSPVSVLENVRTGFFGEAYFDFSIRGSLIYLPGGEAMSSLVWVDRQGQTKLLSKDRHAYQAPRLSPDGKQVATWIPRGDGDQDLWAYDLERRTLTLLASQGDNSLPVWKPDGTQIAFTSSRAGPWNLFLKPVGGGGEAQALLSKQHGQFPTSWSLDGRLLAFYEVNPDTMRDIWVLPLYGDREPSPFLVTPSNERAPTFSPDGSWLAYVSDESGQDEVYVRPYPGPGGKHLISNDGGTEPVWARSGRELFYRNHKKMIAVRIDTSQEFKASTPQVLFEGEFVSSLPAFGYPRYDVSLDGQKFLMVMSEEDSAPAYLNVVLNWFEELKRLVHTKK